MIGYLFLILAAFTATIAVKQQSGIKGTAHLWPDGVPSSDGKRTNGIIEFEEFLNSDGTTSVSVSGNIANVFPADSWHGFHVHEAANYTSGCVSAGKHYNPLKVNHGNISQPQQHRHVGDLGNVYSDKSGKVNVALKDSIIRITGLSVFNIVGRSLVIHESKDDLGLGKSATSKTDGNAGKRLACGTIISVN